jgi:hypothetical protein
MAAQRRGSDGMDEKPSITLHTLNIHDTHNKKMKKIFYLISILLAPVNFCASAAKPTNTLSPKNFNKYWHVESESPDYQVTFDGDAVQIVAPKGLTLWYKEKMNGNVVIEYDAIVYQEKEGDRLSDLNCFWMASDPAAADVFKRSGARGGVFANCAQLQLYYVGYGGNSNTTTRFRRYTGEPDPAIIHEYSDTAHLLKPNHWYHIKLVSSEGAVQYWIDGKRIFDYNDADPYTSGWFGFRTTQSRTAIRNFTCTETAPQPFSAAPLHWIGDTPEWDNPISFGVPFKKGEVTEKTALRLETNGGSVIPTDQWTLAKWPDGSVKWLGVAAVLPGGTDEAKFVKINKPESKDQRMTEDLGDLYKISTGVVTAYVPKSGSSIIASLHVGDTRVGGEANLVASEGDNEYVSTIQKVSLEQNGSVRSTVKIEGKHRSEAGREWLPFVVRMYFYKGSEQIKLVHSFVFDGDQDKDFIRAIGLRFSVPMREQVYNRHIAFSTNEGEVWTESVQPLNGRRILTDPRPVPGQNQTGGMQTPPQRRAFKDYEVDQVNGKRVPEPDYFDRSGQFLLENWAQWDCFRLSQLTDNSFSIRKKTQEDRPWIGTFTGTRTDGYVFAGDVSGGLGVFLKDFWEAYPATLEVRGARSEEASLYVWLWSPESEPMDLRHYDTVAHDLNASYEDVQEGMSTPYGIGRTHTLTLVPQAAFPGREGIAATTEFLRRDAQLLPTPEYLHDVHAFGIWSLPDRSNAKRIAVEDRLDSLITVYKEQVEKFKWYGFWNYGDFMHSMDDVRGVWRYDIGGFAWHNTELASNSWLWYSFLRSGREDIWKLAVAMSRHTTEVDVYHLGPYAGLGSRHNVSHWGCGAKEARIGQSAWNRFLYYLTTDERSGDLMDESKDSEQLLYEIDPMRLAAPRSETPCTAPARLRIGPDWLGYAGNWMTRWERTGEQHYYDMIVTGMKSIAALPNGMLTGEVKVLGFDPATGVLSWEGDPESIGTNHLAVIMGGFEIMVEMMEMIHVPEFNQAWLEHARKYHTLNGFRVSRLNAYAAWHDHDVKLAKDTWDELLQPLAYKVRPNTNSAATWSLDAIYLLEILPLH